MGVFYTAQAPAVATIKSAIEEALKVDPKTLSDPSADAAARTVAVADKVTPQFNAWRFGAATVIAVVLLLTAIWTAQQQGLSDISKTLMTSFSSFSGIVLGLLGGEAQKSTT
jgi:hypothetical protein